MCRGRTFAVTAAGGDLHFFLTLLTPRYRRLSSIVSHCIFAEGRVGFLGWFHILLMLVYNFVSKSLNGNYYYRPYETFQGKKPSEFKVKIYLNEIALCNKLSILQVGALRSETVLTV